LAVSVEYISSGASIKLQAMGLFYLLSEHIMLKVLMFFPQKKSFNVLGFLECCISTNSSWAPMTMSAFMCSVVAD